MDGAGQNNESSWLEDNWILIFFNLILGAVTIVLIWIFTKSGEEETPKEIPAQKKEASKKEFSAERPCKEEPAAEQPIEKEPSVEETSVKDISIEEPCKEELNLQPEPLKKAIIDEVVEDIHVEEIADLKDENEDQLDENDEESIEGESQVKLETTSDSNGEGYIVIKQIETEETTVETVAVDTKDKTVKAAEKLSEVTKYEIDVKTGDVTGAGTDANVFIIIYGEYGDTGKIALEKSSTHKHKFEKNHVDSFNEEAPNVGKINKIRIGHDDKGSFAGWYLGNVVINVPLLNCKWTFEADRWLDKREDDKQIEIDVYPTLIEETHIETIYAEGKLEDVNLKDGADITGQVDVVDPATECHTTVSVTTDTKTSPQGELYVEEVTVTTSEEIHTATINVGADDTNASSHVAIEAVVDNATKSEEPSEIVDDVKEREEFDLHAYSQDALESMAACMEKTDEITGVKRFDLVMSEGMSDPSGEGRNLVTYHIDVKTGNTSGAGTDAHVFVTLYGSQKDTGKLDLTKSTKHKDKFEKGQLDTFAVESIDVGRIEKIRIGHDSKGSFAGWYLDYVIVTVPHTKLKEVFLAHRWLDKKEGDGKIEIDLYPQSSKDSPGQESEELDLSGLEEATSAYIKSLPDDDIDEKTTTEKTQAPCKDEEEIVAYEEMPEVESAPAPCEDEEEVVAYEEIAEVESAPDLFGLSSCSTNEAEFQVFDYHTPHNDSWRIASISDVEANMENVRTVLYDKDWHICALSDGSIGGPGYNYEIGHEVNGLGHKLLIKTSAKIQYDLSVEPCENVTITKSIEEILSERKCREEHGFLKSTNTQEPVEVEFQVVEYHSTIEDGWRMASVKEVELNIAVVKRVLEDKDWYICALIDGNVGGPAYNYNIEYEVKELGHKLIIKGGPSEHVDEALRANADNLVKNVIESVCKSMVKVEFQVVSCDEQVNDGWKLACLQDIHNNSDIAKFALKGKTWHVCALTDGTIAGEGFNYEMKNEINSSCQYKFLVKETQGDSSDEKDLHVSSGTHDDTNELLDGNISITAESGTSLDDTGDLLIAPVTAPADSVDVGTDAKIEVKKSSSISSSDEDVVDEKDKKKKKKEKKKAKKEKRASREGRHSSSKDADESVNKEIEFQVLDFNSPIDDHQWRLATIDDVERHIEKVQNVLADKTWHICALVDGNIGGPGYNYGIRHESKELGHKLLINAVTATYNIVVKTGDRTGAGTDANVFIIIYGPQRETGKIILEESKTHKSKFEKNHVDSFDINTIDVGPITKIRIGHDNKGGFAGWFLDNVEITKTTMDGKLTFIADRWLDLKEADGKLEVELYPLKRIGISEVTEDVIEQCSLEHEPVCLDALDMLHSGEHVECEVSDHEHIQEVTSPPEVKEDATDIKIHSTIDVEIASIVPPPPEIHEDLIVEGVMDEKDIDIKLEKFEDDSTKEEEEAAIKIQSLIRGAKARKEVEAMKSSSAPLLSVQTVEVRIDDEPVTKHTEEHITVEDVGDLESAGHVTFDEELPELVTYEIDVKTGDVMAAGTDANVFLTIFGDKGDTGKIVLSTPKNINKKTFERNCIDSFIVEALDVGTVTSLRIGHDNKGGFAGWYLERVVVNIPSQNCKFTFHANRWLDTKEADGKLEIDLTPAKLDQSCSLYEKVDESDIPEETKVQFVVESDSPLAAENNVHKQIDEEAPSDIGEKQYEVEVKEIVAEMMNYQIDVKTGDIKFAGTDANVFIILYGDRGYTTKLELKNSKTHKRPFERKYLDSFDVQTINVGNLERIRIGHDNHGGFAGWYLDEVVVHAPSIHQSWKFSANRWLDKHKDDGKLEIDVKLSTE